MSPITYGPEAAERIALSALAFIAADEEIGGAFLGATGATADDLRAAATDPAFLVSVLDFLTGRDDWTFAFAEAEGLPPEAPLAARRALPGGEEVAWT
ncbi:uncharacterized protein DUF3572 [Hasllibacter halocynthiae]|uniref:Uncharacterized protein DUF3572 n=1 Tax=Hasllibacter halocynthiae TaxID=595589 RepID=A0A2T0X6R0_9RHOB|nr:DUF3572 domain-containing protein [Hasllibacter halocynthiae]PRY94641.1 uncharacterized protein DUF3572 [Hasllibacter halocynthiae]